MQRAKRRLVCSRASVNTPTSSSSRMRRRSRTTSAGGDCTPISRGCNNLGETSEAKRKLRSNRKNARLNSMKFKRNSKISKLHRPTYGSLQNAVVLAPFHTLKKCFQTKLVDLYSKEKVKNLNKKVRMAKKKNVSFEYDVIELKALNSQKDEKPSVSRKRRLAQVRAKKLQNSSSRSLSYCQCDKKPINSEKASQEHENVPTKCSRGRETVPERKIPKKLVKNNDAQYIEPSPYLYSSLVHSFDNQGIKRKTVDNPNPVTMVMSFKNDFETRNYAFPKSNENVPEGTSSSASNVSSRMDSWETFSDSFSHREEHLQGSLALSTTSFDSFLEQSDKNKRYSSNVEDAKYCLQYKVFEEEKEDDGSDRFLPSKPQLANSGHLIVSSETKNSDDGIVDFMDREPLSRGITNIDIPQNIHPLRRQSRTKEKKQVRDNGSYRNYYLRSVDSNKEGLRQLQVREESLILNSTKNNFMTSTSSSRCNDFEFKRPSNSFHETAQVFAITECRREDKNLSLRNDEKLLKITELQPNHIQLSYEPSFLISKTLESYSQTEEITHNSTPNPKTTLEKKKSSTKNLNVNNAANNAANNEEEPNCEILHQRKSSISPAEQEDAQVNESNKQEKSTDRKGKSEKKDNEDAWKSNTILLPLREGDRNSVEPSGQLPNVEQTNFKTHESSGRPVDRLIQQPENKDSCFIFGPANLSSRLGESCEFSFGLNWVLSSDEENSNHGDLFF